ncbi:RelE/StbE family addiction module toxin [Clostridia bacterium]|nr:RelE/StbE family addiction module toxin [Clostridia bacterium]
MYSIRKTNQFKKDIKLCAKRNCDLSLLSEAMEILAEDGKLPTKYLPHPLKGKYKITGVWDGHIEPDWILLWTVEDDDSDENYEGTIVFVRTGTHSDLF